MLPIVRASVLRDADARALEGGTSVDVLVRRAGAAVARETVRLLRHALGQGGGRRVVAVVGRGHNGADALAALVVLAGRGVQVSAVCVGMARYDALARELLDEVLRSGGRVLDAGSPASGDVLAEAHLVLDGLLGTGMRGPARDDMAAAIDRIAEAGARGIPVLAVDIASGLDPETGEVLGHAVVADVTVTFQALKPGQLLNEGPARSGALTVVDIGVDLPAAAWTMSQESDVASLVKVPHGDQHKRRRGVVVLIAGSVGMAGAASLAAHGAQRAGVGLLVLGVPEEIADRVGAAVPEALTVALPSIAGKITPDAPAALEAWWSQATCLALGPGLGRGSLVTKAVASLLDRAEVPAVVDADGLVALAELERNGGGGCTLLSHRRAKTLLTPHAGEFARLVSPQESDPSSTAFARVAAVAHAWRCVTLLKGNLTIIADPSGRVAVNPTGTPVLATGGTGDVLTGVCAALIAQGLEPFDAARLATWVHGRAGRLAARAASPLSVTAGDVAAALPQAFAELLPVMESMEGFPVIATQRPAPLHGLSSTTFSAPVGAAVDVSGLPQQQGRERVRWLPGPFAASDTGLW